ncbi:MAG: STAS domain-containing protein [Pelosinus sp.]|nr:STAS domain-containing protein [Pelosinus sp.]
MDHIFTVNGNKATLALAGKLYVHDASIIRDELVEKIETGVQQIAINLSDVTYVDSSGLGVLVTVHKLIQRKNGHLSLNGVHGMVEELLKRTRLDKILFIE